MNRKIIDPVPVKLLKAELTKSKKLEDTNKGHNELYIVTWHDSPNVVTEIGRLRELAFREAGGSTGNAMDLDEYDKMEKPYKQLIVWDPDNEAIIGGYRFLFGSEAMFDEKGQPIRQVPTNSIFPKSLLMNICRMYWNWAVILWLRIIRVPRTGQSPYSLLTISGMVLWRLS